MKVVIAFVCLVAVAAALPVFQETGPDAVERTLPVVAVYEADLESQAHSYEQFGYGNNGYGNNGYGNYGGYGNNYGNYGGGYGGGYSNEYYD